ncbi:adenylyl-sulfate kinase [Amycolatopsis bartoniae]|uniref:Adenylyl-sulfate kinase n=1 Tax=Amycolatopsis bartoniae TaxID=941986 RepID=A0A8H9IU02_9PSEU|nr:adenylyl-sulfate kinase [Amycolatopsis bartoniae]
MIWITGLSGAGKSAVASAFVERLRADGHAPVYLDGDELRSALDAAPDFGMAQRRQLACTYARLCRLLSEQGHVVVCATISLQHRVHDWNRRHLPCYVEVLLDVPLEELHRRDPKAIYRAADGHIVGVDLAAEFPLAPHLRIPNHGTTSPDRAATRIHEFCQARGVL